ncbi:MAG: Uncharacterized protein G01um101431_972 [Parcubacteria group bacterium Gr01-1014_31]|nr:MAG: Uncharacterized protein G01um101431_972 [Parcubacteria group bacterium Gr01-1014_31]
MALFSASSSYLGVDVDSHSVKIVELKNDRGRPRLLTYGYFDHPLDYQSKDDSEQDLRMTAALIRETVRKAKVGSRVAISALPAFSVFSSVITLPELSAKELAAAVRWEAKKVIPLPIDEMNLHWDILPPETPGATESKAVGQTPKDPEKLSFNGMRFFGKMVHRKEAGNTRVLLTAAPKALVRRYLTLFREAGLTLLALDTESFSLVRSLIGADPATVMVVDLDFTVTNIMIAQHGVPYLNRSINVGGLTITRGIATALNVSLDRAEQLKYDIGMQQGTAAGSIPTTIAQALAPVVDEVRYSLNLYRSQGRPPIERVILTGGSSLLANLPQYLGNLLQLRVFLGDPWARVICPEELKPALDEIGPRFSVAIGLGMKEIS